MMTLVFLMFFHVVYQPDPITAGEISHRGCSYWEGTEVGHKCAVAIVLSDNPDHVTCAKSVDGKLLTCTWDLPKKKCEE